MERIPDQPMLNQRVVLASIKLGGTRQAMALTLHTESSGSSIEKNGSLPLKRQMQGMDPSICAHFAAQAA